ncbi:MAG: hypothetical protein GY775_11680 [Candidatus Scalindua sp.]|nr:hypothetical protein [Candidatus Scalindua sp.]
MANLKFNIKWPVDGKKTEIRIEREYYDRLLNYQPTNFLNLRTVHKVLNNPSRIFLGLNRLYSDSRNRVCVVGKPETWFIGKSKSIEAPFPSDLVYLVFLSERYSIFEFGPEKADKEDRLSPIDWQNRYGEVIWKMIS